MNPGGWERDGSTMTMTIAEEFTAAYAAAASAEVAGPELLPVRLARACVEVLPVAGVGISMFGSSGMRIPVGASDDDAAAAERLQFTAAEGPCLDAHALARSVLATETLIAQRWPDFYTGLLARTPYRAVAAIPWPRILQGAGTVDLLFHRSRDLADLDIRDVDDVVAQLERTLVSESVVEFSVPGLGPAWLTARPRTPATRWSSRWASSTSPWTSPHRTRWPCSADMPTPPAAPSMTSPRTSPTAGYPPTNCGSKPTSDPSEAVGTG